MISDIMNKIGNKIKILLWPEVCPFCQRAWRDGICPDCQRLLEKLVVQEPRCMQCGKPVRSGTQEYCYDCMHTHHHYDRGVSLWYHRPPVSTSIYQFKYHNRRVYGACYAKEILRQYQRIVKRWDPDVIIPIPLHKRRRRRRGYNQAQILAEELGRMLGIPVDDTHMIRRRYTVPQKQLGHGTRKRNLKGAFALRPGFDPVHTALVVDYIYTTGSTIDAAAEILKKAGVEKVFFLTISIGQGY